MATSGGLESPRLRLRPVVEDDVPRLAALRATPEVRRWWRGDPTGADLVADLDDDEVVRFAIEHDGETVGLIQYAEETDPEYRHAGIDVFLGPDVHRRGLGSEAIRTVLEHLVLDRGHHRITIDPAADNIAAIACYRSLGFRPVGVMRRYEQGEDGSWHDGLLLEFVVGVDEPHGWSIGEAS